MNRRRYTKEEILSAAKAIHETRKDGTLGSVEDVYEDLIYCLGVWYWNSDYKMDNRSEQGEKEVRKLVTAVVKRPYTFLLSYNDGRTEWVTVQAESESAAALLLPDKAEVGEYRHSPGIPLKMNETSATE